VTPPVELPPIELGAATAEATATGDGRPAATITRVGAGVKWDRVAPRLSAHGLAGLHGSSPDVGIAGYSLGGGMGWLARKYGLQSNAVTALELVTADGSVVRADAEHHPDLFWALRGGGGNFGVVTARAVFHGRPCRPATLRRGAGGASAAAGRDRNTRGLRGGAPPRSPARLPCSQSISRPPACRDEIDNRVRMGGRPPAGRSADRHHKL
jgi:hypothetical protein